MTPPMTPDDPASPKLADFLCFAIYSANLAFGRAYRPILEELGLTYLQYITVVALWEEDNQTVRGLGEKLFLESNTLTPILKKLEAMGYVTRQRDPEDERQGRAGPSSPSAPRRCGRPPPAREGPEHDPRQADRPAGR